MEPDNTLTAIAIIYFFMFLSGWGYATYIRYHPWKRTWVEVVVGTGGTVAGIMGVTYLLLTLDPIPVNWIVFNPLVCFVITGISQIIHQELKVREEARKAEEEKINHNGNFNE